MTKRGIYYCERRGDATKEFSIDIETITLISKMFTLDNHPLVRQDNPLSNEKETCMPPPNKEIEATTSFLEILKKDTLVIPASETKTPEESVQSILSKIDHDKFMQLLSKIVVSNIGEISKLIS